MFAYIYIIIYIIILWILLLPGSRWPVFGDPAACAGAAESAAFECRGFTGEADRKTAKNTYKTR